MQASSYVDTCNNVWEEINGKILSIRPKIKNVCCMEHKTVEVCPCVLDHMKMHHNIMDDVKCTGITNSDINTLVDSLVFKDENINYDNINDIEDKNEIKNEEKPVKSTKRKTTKVN